LRAGSGGIPAASFWWCFQDAHHAMILCKSLLHFLSDLPGLERMAETNETAAKSQHALDDPGATGLGRQGTVRAGTYFQENL
jgi:hypothetical protein